MNVLSRLYAILAVRAEEAPRIGALTLHSFLNGFATSIFFAVGYGLFLESFEPGDLPLAYLVSAALGWAVVVVFARAERTSSFARLAGCALVAALGLVAVLGWAIPATGAGWLVFFTFVMVSPLHKVLELELWGVTTRLFDLRQSKRLFAWVEVAGVLSSALGFFLVPVLLLFVANAVDLLAFGAGALAFNLLVALALFRVYPGELMVRAGDPAAPAPGVPFAALLRDRYFVLLAAVTAISIVASYLVDLSFMMQASARYFGAGSGAVAASFIALFFGAAKLVELGVKVFFAGRLVTRIGVRRSLLALPWALLPATLAAALIGSLAEPSVAFFFLLVALGKLLWIVLGKTVFGTSLIVFFQPVAEAERPAFQRRIDGVVSEATTFLVALALWALTRADAGPLLLLWLAVPVFVAWIVVGRGLHDEYRSRLVADLASRVRRRPAPSPLDELSRRIREGPPEDHPYLMRILERLDAAAVRDLLVEKLSDVLPQIRVAAIERLRGGYEIDALEAIRRCGEETELPIVRAAAEGAVAELEDLRRLAQDRERITVMAHSSDPAERRRAAAALGWRTADPAPDTLAELLWDHEASVRRWALVAAGRAGHPAFWPQILSHLTEPRFATAATRALIAIGEPALPELELIFRRSSQTLGVRLRVLNIYARIGGDRVRGLVQEKLHFHDKEVRRHALSLLNLLGAGIDPAEIGFVRRKIDEVAATVAWNTAALLDLGEGAAVARVCEALESEITHCRRLLFMLLALLHDPRAVDLVRENVENEIGEGTAYALEILEVLVDPRLKDALFPVFEDVPPVQRLRQLARVHPVARMGRKERLWAVIHRNHSRISSWTKACAMVALGTLARRVPAILVANLFHPDPMLQQIAALSLRRIDSAAYARHVAKLPYVDRERVERVVGADPRRDAHSTTSLFDRIATLSKISGFSGLSWDLLYKLAQRGEERVLPPRTSIPTARDPEGTLYLILEGFLESPAEISTTGSRSIVAARPLVVPRLAVEACRVLRFDGDDILDLVAEHAELVPAILETGARSARDVSSLSIFHSAATRFRVM